MAESLPALPVERVHKALETIYREFAAPVPSVIEGCPCCIATRGVDVLLTTPLRHLTGQALWRYVSGVFYTVGSECDFRYLLPRILEISIVDPGNALYPQIVLGKLGLANWQSWSVRERQSIEAFIDAWFELALAQDLAWGDEMTGEIADVLCGAARAGLSLSRWERQLGAPVSAPALAGLIERFPRRPSGFWEDAPDGYRELSEILARNGFTH
jgi:hypothetical protein